jgi:hypothetical protein
MTADPRTGSTISPARRVQNLLEEIELADQVGLGHQRFLAQMSVGTNAARQDNALDRALRH